MLHWLQTAQAPPLPPPMEAKAMEAALLLSQTLTQWAFLIVAASVLAIVGTSIYPQICGLAKHMSANHIREREAYLDGATHRYELTDICSQVLALAI